MVAPGDGAENVLDTSALVADKVDVAAEALLFTEVELRRCAAMKQQPRALIRREMAEGVDPLERVGGGLAQASGAVKTSGSAKSPERSST